jgi:hypothetical protein
VAAHILRLAEKRAERPATRLVAAAERFSINRLLPNLVQTIEGVRDMTVMANNATS